MDPNSDSGSSHTNQPVVPFTLGQVKILFISNLLTQYGNGVIPTNSLTDSLKLTDSVIE